MVLFRLFLCIFMAASINAQAKDTIVIVKNDWTSQIVLSNVLKNILDGLGYKTKLKELKTKNQWGEIPRGLSHVQIEVWQGTMETMHDRLIKEGNTISMGTHDATTREDWWYPLYVKKLCPGLPDWKALKKCSHIFKNKNSDLRGVYIGGPWEKPDKARVRALGLNFDIERVKNGDALWVELEKAFKIKKPIILFNWTPNWIESKYEGEFVNFPKFDPKCETDASWGISKKWKYDCGNPRSGWLKKIAWKGLKEKWPCANDVIKNFNLNNKMIAQAAALVDADKLSYEDAAKKWLSLNTETWKSWIPKDCKLNSGSAK